MCLQCYQVGFTVFFHVLLHCVHSGTCASTIYFVHSIYYPEGNDGAHAMVSAAPRFSGSDHGDCSDRRANFQRQGGVDSLHQVQYPGMFQLKISFVICDCACENQT